MGTHREGGDPANYTIAGSRFWFNRLVDDTASPVRYEGFKDMGNVVDSSLEQAIEELEHFSSKSGTRRRDRSLVTQIEEETVLTLDEANAENLRAFFRAGTVLDHPLISATAPSAWAATTAYSVGDWVIPTTPNGFYYRATIAGTSDGTEPTWPTAEGDTVVDDSVTWQAWEDTEVTNEIMQLVGVEERIISKYAPENIVVKDITDITTHVLDTDYEVVDVIGGYKAVRIKAGGAILSGDFVRVNYNYVGRASRRTSPATEMEVIGQALFFAVSDTGNEFIRSFRKAQIEPEGAFEPDDEDWSDFQLRLKILDDTDVVPTAPFGIMDHYGTGQDL